MVTKMSSRLFLGIPLILCLSGRCPAADPISLPPGLELHLDAAWEAEQLGTQHRSGDRIEIWHDRSTRQRHARQPEEQCRPQLVRIDGTSGPSAWVVRFDGENDSLRALGTSLRLADATVFVVAAPHSNPGNFRGFLAANAPGRRDYESGFTLDMSWGFSADVRDINVEGAGFGGARNLLKEPFAFGTLSTLEFQIDSHSKQVRLAIDGRPQATREFQPRELNADELTIGARYYENSAAPQRIQGHLAGDIAEVLVFNRILNDEERQGVRKLLQVKYAPLREALVQERRSAAGANVEPLVTVPNPPPVQMLVPGFEVEELPISLNNINNLRYRPDGKLYALGYDGDVWLLHDADGDGQEETVHRFFENQGRLRGPIGMAVIPLGHPLLRSGRPGRARGIVVASKGKVSALLDLDGDDVAEEERIIAAGWQEITQNVDAIGVAIHPRDGAIYFGLGCAAYNNAYLLDEQGRSRFDLASERGTIQRIEPDLSKRTTVCTGVRFTIGLEFNEFGDLFASEQEGATWLANGNPFDELLHIRPGLHFGFPPRHPRHLPEVFDEPSLFDYGPQHQSTCGMAFNVPHRPGGPHFGPEHWRGDLFVCGESRGKLYRTRLIRRADGEYVAENQLVACLSMLAVDCRVSPRGDLLVCCHGGGPDWGTGPGGKGRIFRIRYVDRDVPQPLRVWAAGPREVQILFDRPLDPAMLSRLNERTTITAGTYVAAGDRFESLRPGYAVTQLQWSTPRFKLPVRGTAITPDRRTILLTTDPQEQAVSSAITLPGLGRPQKSEAPFSQYPEIDLAYSLNGVSAVWTADNSGQSPWIGWLPTLDLAVARALTTGSPTHDEFWRLLEQPGRLALRTQLDPRGIFTPAVQPNSQLDYALDDDRFVTERRLQIQGAAEFSTTVDQDAKDLVPVVLEIATGGESLPRLSATWHVTLADGKSRFGAIPLHRFLLPWTRLHSEPASGPIEIPELADASWGRGRQIFQSEQAGCSKCHLVDGKGGRIGPDLSNVIHRDYASVVRDITLPSYAINPDFITYGVALTDGRVLTGAVRNDGDFLLIGDKDGKEHRIPRADVESLVPSTVSTMPEGLSKKLDEKQFKDLLAFLLKPAPLMPRDALLPRPQPRSRDEVAAVLAGADAPNPGVLRALNVLLVAGAKDHGPGEHDYPAWLKTWSELLRAAPGVTVDTAMEWPTSAQIEAADVIAFFQRGTWNDERAAAIDAHLARGRGLVYIHWAVNGDARAPEFAQRIGLASSGSIKFRHGPLDLGFDTGRGHPIARNLDAVHFHDESYWLLSGDPQRIRVLGAGVEEGERRPLFWTFEPGRGRVFVSIPGHYSWTFDDPLFRVLLLRGMAWSAGESVDRFNELVTAGTELR